MYCVLLMHIIDILPVLEAASLRRRDVARQATTLTTSSLPVSDGKTQRLIGPVLAWLCARSVPAPRHLERQYHATSCLLSDNCCCTSTQSPLPLQRYSHEDSDPRRHIGTRGNSLTLFPGSTKVPFCGSLQTAPRSCAPR